MFSLIWFSLLELKLLASSVYQQRPQTSTNITLTFICHFLLSFWFRQQLLVLPLLFLAVGPKHSVVYCADWGKMFRIRYMSKKTSEITSFYTLCGMRLSVVGEMAPRWLLFLKGVCWMGVFFRKFLGHLPTIMQPVNKDMWQTDIL